MQLRRTAIATTLVVLATTLALVPNATSAPATTFQTDDFTATGIAPAPRWSFFSTQRHTTDVSNTITVKLTTTGGGTSDSIGVALSKCGSDTIISNTDRIGAPGSSYGSTASLTLNASTTCFRLAMRGYGTTYVQGSVTYKVFA